MANKLARCQNILSSLILVSVVATFIIGGFIYYDTLNFDNDSKKVETSTTSTTGSTSLTSKTTAKVSTTTNDGLHLHPSLIVDRISEPEKFEAYSVITSHIKRSLDTKFSVCDEFYQYVNSRRGSSLDIFEELKQEVVGELIRALEQPVKLNVLEKAKIYYNKCSEAEKNPEIIHQNGKVLQQIYKTVVSATPLQFAFLYNATLEKPSPRELSEIIGYLLREYDVNVFLKLSIKTNWKNPTGLFGHKGYRVFLEQPELKFAKDEGENEWDKEKKQHQEQVKRLFVEFAKVLNKTVDESEIELDAWNVIELERRIAFEARNFDRISKEKLFNVYTKQGAAEQFAFDFTTYFDELSKQLNTDVKEILQGNELEFIITDPSFLQKLEALISSRQTSSRTIYNYIVWKLLENLEVYFPQEKKEISVNDNEVFKSKCAEKTAENLNDLTARIYIDFKFIYPKKLEELKDEIGGVVEQVVAGFQMQIDKLSWMAESTKEKISKKLRFMARNLLLNDKINIDQYLIDKFDDLLISNSLDYNQITKNINTFNFQQNFNKLLLDSTERDEFLHPITSLNPSYDYEFNSITIPVGLIRRPIYDKDFPASVKFANLGFLIAKALMKTVDDEGVQWDEIGKLENWMDEKSIDGKAVMEECLANKTKISDETVIKRVVENGGAIKAAYNAYEAHVDLHGQDKLFPDKKFSQLTHDQVFFISYTNIHTENDESAEGVLQNFAAFKSAFYCPVETKYAPKEHCRIWDSEAKAVKGIPPTPPVKSSLEIGNKAVGNSTEYEQVTEFISQRMSVEYSPCENFYEFACCNAKDVDVDLKRSIKENLKKRIMQYLETTQSNDERFAKIGKSFFQTCSNQQFNEGLIKIFIDKIDEKFGIKFPLLSNATYDASTLPEIGEFGHFLSSTYDIHPFFRIDVQPNLRKQFNTNPYLLTYSDFELTFRPQIYGQLEWPEIKEEYIEISVKFLRKIADIDANSAKISILRAIEIEEKLAELLTAPTQRHIRDSDYEIVSLHEFHHLFPFFKISGFIRGIYQNEGKNVTNFLQYILNRQSKVAIYQKARQIERHYAVYTAFKQEKNAFLDSILLRILWKYQFFFDAEEIQISRRLRSSLFLPLISGNDVSDKRKSCLSLLSHVYPPIFGNLAVKALYPKNDDFKIRQKEVATIAEYVLQSFEDIFNRLSWLSLSEKRVLISKIREISRIYGAPKWVLDGKKLDLLYSNLTHIRNADIATRWLEANAFKRIKMYQRITQGGEIRRDGFLSAFSSQITVEFEATVDYDTNSFYFPLPFLEHDLVHEGHPAIWKFVMIGDEIGKILGKLFDESGLERNELGMFSKWMKAETRKRVKEMVDELEKGYEVIGRGRGWNINEEFAENVGLKLSLRGLQSYSDYFGDDLALPNKTLSHLSSGQLYFLLHTQQYCQKNLIDTFATPNNVTVLGHLRNSEEFRTAYHCKADSLYAPKDFAKVWNSPAKTSVGLPIYDKALPNLNVPKRKSNHSKKYLECAKYFEDSVDNSIDPCEDFYSYTCNNYNGRDTFTDLDLRNALALVKSMIIDIKRSDNQAVKKAKTFYNKCREDYHKTYDDVDVAKAVVTEIEEVFGHKFSLQYNDSKDAIVTPEELSYTIGYLSGKYGQDVIVSSMIYTNSRHPDKGYSVYLAAEEFEEESKRKIREIAKELNEYLQYIRSDIDEIQEKVLEMATAFVKIEAQFFAAARRSQDLDMRNFSDIYSPIAVKKFEEKYGTSFKVKSYLKGLVNLMPELEEKITDDDFELTIEDERAFKNVTKELTMILQEHNEYLADYIFYRTIQMANQEFSLGVMRAMEEGQEVPRKRRKGWKRKLPRFPGQGIHYPKKDIDILSHPEAVALGLTAADLKCLQPTKELFNEALNHIFVKTIHPNDTERDDQRMEATKIVDSTLLGFRSMLDQLNWMNGKSKEEAYNKIGQLVKNVAYPNISVDESKLEAYYKDLDISSVTDFREMNIKLFVFNQRKIIDDLKKTSFDRLDFGSVFDLNAWYQQAANSITFPLSILQAPFFDPEWPAAVNYGSIGMVAGHELTHGFDDQGIQWDGDGRLQNWISNSSFQSFRKMADCVVDQYSQFCYVQQQCVNGTNTQGENIADNGGIQAAFRAFRNELSLKADAQSLPGEFIGRFTADQLFFLAFGRVWCAAPLSNREREMVLEDVHSPSNFRVLGALRNFPAFKDAFNCPLKKKDSPEKHCQVWITDVEPNLSTPPTTTTAPPINVPQRSLVSANNSAYNEASQGILKSLDLQQDVCNDFYGYVCHNFHTKDLTLKEEATENIAKHILKNLEDDSIQFPHKKLINLYYASCVEERSEQNSKKKSVEKLLEGLEKVTGSKYPAFEDSEFEISANSEDFLEKSIGFLQGHHNIGSIFDTRVERNLETSNLTNPVNLLHIGAPKLIYHHDVYNNDSDEDTRNRIIGEYFELLVEYSKIIGKTPKSLEKLAKDVYYLERLLASICKNHSLRQGPKYHQNLIALQDLQTELKGIKFNKFFEVMLEKSSEEIKNMFLKADGLVENRIVSTFGVEHIKELFRKIYGNQVTDESLLNYFYFRLLWSQRELILNLNSDGLPPNKDDIENTKLSCALQTRDIPILTSRVFLEKQHVVFEVVKDKVLIMTSSLINTLQGLLAESTWISAAVKTRIINKLGALQVNVIADQKIFDNEYLSRYFEGLSYKEDMTSSELKLAVEEFVIAKGYQILNFTSPSQMTEFEATTPDISYDYSKNTLNIPAAAVLAPFYNPEYPFTINFAALGVKIAEHLTQSFDLYGVQIDQNGRFAELDEETSLGYGNLGKCFYKQYGIDANNEFSSILGHNAAIHIAKQALQLTEDFSGHSPSFADNILRQFTEDQVFYIKYSGQFCDHPNAKNELRRGSNKVELLNILQNDAEFGTTFNCPANSKYVSENRCELFSMAKIENQNVHIAPQPKVISKLDNSYEKYKKIVKHLNESLDINVDPCNDFYEYTCGKLNPNKKTKEQVNLQTQIEAIKAITGAEKSPALRKLRQYFDQCVDFHKNFDDKIRDGTVIKNKVQEFIKQIGNSLRISMYSKSKIRFIPLQHKIISYLQLFEDLQTFITTTIEVDNRVDGARPGVNPMLLTVDEPTLLWPKVDYIHGWGASKEKKYKEEMLEVLVKFGKIWPNAIVDEAELGRYIDTFFFYERMMTKPAYYTPDREDSQPTIYPSLRMNKFNFLQWTLYTNQLVTYTGLPRLSGARYAVKFEDTLLMLTKNIGQLMKNDDNKVNYFFMRLLMKYKHLIPGVESPKINAEEECARQTQKLFKFANGKAYINYVSGRKDSTDLLPSLQRMFNNIRSEFRGTIDDIRWISEEDRRFMHKKLLDLHVNWLYPNIVRDINKLDKYYSRVSIGKDYFETTQNLNLDNFRHQMEYLTNANYLEKFGNSPSEISGWNRPEYNSLTIPQGLVELADFDKGFPASINYGRLGVQVARELSKVFERPSLQWAHAVRNLTLVTKAFKDKIDEMEKCLANQYPKEIDVSDVKADNTGIHVAYRAYNTHKQLNGPDPQLPDLPYSKYTHDQLFFLSFATSYCDYGEESYSRLSTSIKNFPAFRSAFNCPVDSLYTPKDRCRVWLPDES